MANLKSILKKKKWTGREVGIIEIEEMCLDFKCSVEGKPYKPITTDGLWQLMRESLVEREDKIAFNGYIDLHHWLLNRFNQARSFWIQALYRYYKLFTFVESFISAETVYGYIADLPKIMTRKQYEKALAEGRERRFHEDEEGNQEEQTDCISKILLRAIRYYHHLLETEPKKANPLKALHKQYSKEPVTSQLILQRYNAACNLGYYQTEAGVRSDTTTPEEWAEAVCSNKEVLPAVVSAIKCIDATKAEYNSSRSRYSIMAILDSLIEQTGYNPAYMKKTYEDSDFVKTEWVTYTEPPTGLNKWEVLPLLDKLYPTLDYYEGDYAGEVKDFCQEFEALVEVMIKDIDKAFPPAQGDPEDKPIKEMAPEEWQGYFISLEEQYQRDHYGFRQEFDRPKNILPSMSRERYNGVAILEEDTIASHHIDKLTGNFKEPRVLNFGFDLMHFSQESKTYAKKVKALEEDYSLLLDSYYFIKGHNIALDKIIEHFSVDGIAYFKYPEEELESKMEAYNDLLKFLHGHIDDNGLLANKELQEKKREILEGIFTPIDYKSIQIPEDNISKAVKLFKGFEAFNVKQAEFISLLMERDAGRAE